MAEITVFHLILRSPASEQCSKGTAAVVPFPFSRRRHLVERHARVMRGMSDDDGEIYLMKALEQVCEELSQLGIDCQSNDAIEDLADAIGKELHGPSFVLKIEGGAE